VALFQALIGDRLAVLLTLMLRVEFQSTMFILVQSLVWLWHRITSICLALLKMAPFSFSKLQTSASNRTTKKT